MLLSQFRSCRTFIKNDVIAKYAKLVSVHCIDLLKPSSICVFVGKNEFIPDIIQNALSCHVGFHHYCLDNLIGPDDFVKVDRTTPWRVN